MALILTLGVDALSFARFERARQTHFPPERNFVPAHITLFQQLPNASLADLLATLASLGAKTAPLPFAVEGILDFDRGAAFALDMPGFETLHQRLRQAWSDLLTPADDRQRRPHVTVQNKVDKATATATQQALRAGFAPWQGLAESLLLWHYRGGPWEPAGDVLLQGEPR